MTTTSLRLSAAAALFALGTVVQAQGNASAAATGMAGNYTALARNFNTAAWNPANLGLDGNSRFSLAVAPQLFVGSGPITLADLKEYEGVVVPASVRETWLAKVGDNGGQALDGELDITPFAMSIGRFAFAATSTVRANGTLPTAMAELLLFGNAGRTGAPRDYALTDLRLDGNAATTLSIAYGRTLNFVPVGDFAIGVTGKYLLGHAAGSMIDNGSTITSTPVSLGINAPFVVTDTAEFINGSGFGMDVGASWQVGNLRTSAVVHDVFSTFAWKTDNLYYMPVQASFTQSTSTELVDSLVPLSQASPALRDQLRARIENATPTPTLALGLAWTGIRRLTLAADLRQRFGDGIDLGPDTQVGVGAELRLIPFIPLRAGVTALGTGMRYAGGLGFELGLVNFQAALQVLQSEGRNDSGFGFTLSFGGR